MVNAIIASVALMASTALAQSVGSAVVINKCSGDVDLCAVPASGGGYDSITKTLAFNDQFIQTWTELTNGDGWSLKLNPSNGTASNIMQYEYTFHNDGIIWYDLSDVNGNPWNGDWEITSDSGDCTPRQAAYAYATDDAYGMQACAQNATITVTLCSGDEANAGAAASASSSVAAESSTAVAASTVAVSSYAAVVTTSSAEASTSSSAPTTVSTSAVVVSPTSTEVSSTTFATSTSTSISSVSGTTVGVVETVYYTDVQTVTHWQTQEWSPPKREATPAPHVHNHAARHPHARA